MAKQQQQPQQHADHSDFNQHEHRLLHKMDKKLDYMVVHIDLMLEAIEAAGDPARIKAITKKLKASVAALKAAGEEADQSLEGK